MCTRSRCRGSSSGDRQPVANASTTCTSTTIGSASAGCRQRNRDQQPGLVPPVRPGCFRRASYRTVDRRAQLQCQFEHHRRWLCGSERAGHLSGWERQRHLATERVARFRPEPANPDHLAERRHTRQHRFGAIEGGLMRARLHSPWTHRRARQATYTSLATLVAVLVVFAPIETLPSVWSASPTESTPASPPSGKSSSSGSDVLVVFFFFSLLLLPGLLRPRRPPPPRPPARPRPTRARAPVPWTARAAVRPPRALPRSLRRSPRSSKPRPPRRPPTPRSQLRCRPPRRRPTRQPAPQKTRARPRRPPRRPPPLHRRLLRCPPPRRRPGRRQPAIPATRRAPPRMSRVARRRPLPLPRPAPPPRLRRPARNATSTTQKPTNAPRPRPAPLAPLPPHQPPAPPRQQRARAPRRVPLARAPPPPPLALALPRPPRRAPRPPRVRRRAPR